MSEQYLVSARKYRPQQFNTVVGQEHITTTLKNAIKSNHLAHAYLFCGPRGVGKTSCARILAKTINCLQPTVDMEACGTCDTCKAFQENSAFNVFELDAASNNSVDDIRELVEQVRYAPTIGKYKIYIIDEVHMLSAQAFNAFLKTLEEPPSYAIFILATTEKQKILPTILSRCQIFEFKRISSKEIVHHLEGICNTEHLTATPEALHVIAQQSEGCMRDALSIFDRISGFTEGAITYEKTIEHLNILDATFYFNLLDTFLTTDVSSMMVMVDQVLKNGFEGDILINGLASHLRDLLLCKDQKMVQLLDLPTGHKSRYFERANMLPLEFIVSALTILNESEINYRVANNKRLHLEMTFIKLCYLNNALHQATIPSEDEKKNPNSQGKVNVTPPKQETFRQDNPSNNYVAPPVLQPKPLVSNPVVQKTTEEAKNTTAPTASSRFDYQSASQKPIETQKNEVIGNLGATNAPPQLKSSSNFLSKLAAQAKAEMKETKVIPLTQELLNNLYTQFRQEFFVAQGKSVINSSLEKVDVLLKAENDVLMYAHTSFSKIYADNYAEQFKQYLKDKTGNKNLNLLTEVAAQAEQEETPIKSLTKGELFEKFAERNQALKMLKDNLRLEIVR